MRMLTESDFFYEIGDADHELKAELYERVKKIEDALIAGKIAASKSNRSYGFQSIGGFLEQVSLNAPNLKMVNKSGNEIGEISLPKDLKEFVQVFCLGSTSTAFYLLKVAKITARESQTPAIQSLITDLQPKTYFMNIVDRLYNAHIGNNPKYSRKKPIKASKEQLIRSTIYTKSMTISKDEVERAFVEYMQNIFNQDPRATGSRSLHPVLEGYCQVCHRPNIANKKYCHFHQYDPLTRNNPAKKPLRWAKQAFRNLGLILRDEFFLAKKNPNTYIELAQAKRLALAIDQEQQKNIQSKVLSEYCQRLEGWAKHHPIYRVFIKEIKTILKTNKQILDHTAWDNQECLSQIRDIVELCKNTQYFPAQIFPKDLKKIPLEELKLNLLGLNGLDIEPALHHSITFNEWVTMLCRYYQLDLALSCRKKKVANQLKY